MVARGRRLEVDWPPGASTAAGWQGRLTAWRSRSRSWRRRGSSRGKGGCFSTSVNPTSGHTCAHPAHCTSRCASCPLRRIYSRRRRRSPASVTSVPARRSSPRRWSVRGTTPSTSPAAWRRGSRRDCQSSAADEATRAGYGDAVPIIALLMLVLMLAAVTPLLARRPGLLTGVLVADGVVLLSLAVVMTAYVVAEDDYRHDGRSRWTVYDAHAVTVAAVAAAVIAAAVALFTARRRGPAWATPVAAFVAVCLAWDTLVQRPN